MNYAFNHILKIWNSERKLRIMRDFMPVTSDGVDWKALCTKRLSVLYAIRRDRNVNPY